MKSRHGVPRSGLPHLAAGLLLALSVDAAVADGIEAGLWKVTTITILNGNPVSPQIKNRCLTQAEAADPGKTFSPEVATVNSSCERTEYQLTAQRLIWRLQCKGQLDMDVAGDFTFESRTRYVATIATKGSMLGRTMTASTAAIEGEHIGECN
jgi:hypothetical protein